MKIKPARIQRIHLLLLFSTFSTFYVAQPSTCSAQGTAFTYQGKLNDGTSPANGMYDLQFTLFSVSFGSGTVAGPITNSPVGVTNGLFVVTLDFGANFPGADRWLEIGVRTNGGGAFATLSPRQKITPTPYAIYSGKAMTLDGTVGSNQLVGTYSGSVTFENPANMFTGKFTGDGGMLTNVSAETLDGLGSDAFWKLLGNGGTTAGTHFLGTTDNQPLELKVNNRRALRLEDNGDGTDAGMVLDGAPNVIGGSPGNFVRAGIVGATIAGGGATNYLFLPATNSVLADYGSIGGGVANTIQTVADESTIGGGGGNTIQTNASRSTIGGGENNTIYERFATISGGDENLIFYQGIRSTIGGGTYNTIQAGWSTISGGTNNTVGTGADCATIGGGLDNKIQLFSGFATIGGGIKNNIGTNANYCTIGGGSGNSVGVASAYVTIAGGNTNNIGTNSAYGAIGGGDGNGITRNSQYATIAGGRVNSIGTNSAYSAIGGGWSNSILGGAEASVISGGENNTIGVASAYVTIAGGHTNDVGRNSTYSAIGGGDHNSISDDSLSATIAGGTGNTIGDNADFSVINGGAGNRNFSSRAFIGGGESNVISLVSSSTVIAGGNENTILPSASYSAIGGGRSNLVNVGATYSCIPGGRDNAVDGDYAFAAGRRAKANNSGAFVWGDSTDADIASTNANSVTMRAAGGYRLFTSTGSNGAFLAGGSGSWTSMSDRNSKENFHAIEPLDVLEKVAALNVQTWNYKSQRGGIRHIGPMAQDFYAAFHVGETDTGITTVDADGVALAAIQGLNQKLEQKETEIGELKRELAELKELVGRLATSKYGGDQ